MDGSQAIVQCFWKGVEVGVLLQSIQEWPHLAIPLKVVHLPLFS